MDPTSPSHSRPDRASCDAEGTNYAMGQQCGAAVGEDSMHCRS